MMPVEIKKPEKKAEVADKGKADEKKDDKPKAADEGKKAATSNSKEKVAAAVASKGLLKIIGSASGGGGAFDDVLGNSNGVGNIADALSGASGVGVATSDNVGTGGPRGGTAGTAAGIGDLGTSGGGNVGLGEKVAAQVHGKVADSTPDVESGTVDREKLASYVRARKGAIQNCYEKELKRSPTLKGKVTVRFSITSSGRTSEIEIEENTLGNEAVASCIRTLIRGWVFPFKPDGDVSVSYPFVFSPAS
jgi:TonB family protein